MDQYIGEIRLFCGNFPPRGWAFCDGQTLPIPSNTPLFSIIGNRYGGDGRTTFALPDLRDRAAMHQGRGPGLTPRAIGTVGGSATVTLSTAQLPPHRHAVRCQKEPTQTTSEGAVWANAEGRAPELYSRGPANVQMHEKAVASTGESAPHDNLQPYLGVHYIIALEGDFPNRPS